MTDIEYGLGRIAAEDHRDLGYPSRAESPAAAPHERRPRVIYQRGPQLSQGKTGSCVGQSWRNWLTAVPMTTTRGPSAFDIYDAATQVDEWPDNDADTERQFGSSVRAGAKCLSALGHIERYVWATTAEDVLAWMLTGRGGVVLGIQWSEDMFRPSAEGIIRATGPVSGGHAISAFGADEKAGMLYLVNSWGSGWGGWAVNNGRRFAGCAKLPLEDLERLLRENGECAAAIQRRVRAPR